MGLWLIQAMAQCPIGAKPLLELILTYYDMDPQKQMPVKLESKW